MKRPPTLYRHTPAQAPWSERRLTLLRQLFLRSPSVNRSHCPPVGRRLPANTLGGDLTRLIDEGLAQLTGKPTGVRTPLALNGALRRPRRQSSARRVVLTAAGQDRLRQEDPAFLREQERLGQEQAAVPPETVPPPSHRGPRGR